MDDDFNERLKAFKRELRELGEDVEQLRKRKASGDDVEQVVAKVVAIESEMRAKFGTLASQNSEIQQALISISGKIDAITNDLSHQKKEVKELGDNAKVSTLQRIPVWCWVLMAIGVFATLQLGMERWGEIRGMVP